MNDQQLKKELDKHPELREERGKRMAKQREEGMSINKIAEYWECSLTWTRHQLGL